MAAAFRIRPFEPADFPAICELDVLCFPAAIAYPPEEVAWFLGQRGSICFVAEAAAMAPEATMVKANTDVHGWILGGARRGGAGHIITIDVHPGWRRRGVGDALMDELEGAFREAGCRTARLEVAVDNTGAQAFYARRGYAMRKTIRNYYADGSDAYLMERTFSG